MGETAIKRVVIVCAVTAVVLFGGRLLLSWGTWSSCTHDGGSAFVLAFEHLGAPPSMTDCALLLLSAPAPTEPATTETPPSAAGGDQPRRVPPTTGPCPDGYPPVDDSRDAGTYTCTDPTIPVDQWPMYLQPPASGPCPLGYPPASHFMCTTPTIPPEQWPRSP